MCIKNRCIRKFIASIFFNGLILWGVGVKPLIDLKFKNQQNARVKTITQPRFYLPTCVHFTDVPKAKLEPLFSSCWSTEMDDKGFEEDFFFPWPTSHHLVGLFLCSYFCPYIDHVLKQDSFRLLLTVSPLFHFLWQSNSWLLGASQQADGEIMIKRTGHISSNAPSSLLNIHGILFCTFKATGPRDCKGFEISA